MEHKTIAFIGKAGSGKTTACDYIMSKHDGFTKLNFKDALVKEMKKNFPDVLAELQKVYSTGGVPRLGLQFLPSIDDLFKEKPPTMRALMQNYGTEVRRGDCDTYWTDQWTTARTALGDVLTDDCRFYNEASAIHDCGGMIIKIERDDITDTGSHQSEMEMEKIGYTHIIHTTKGDFEGMYKQIDLLV